MFVTDCGTACTALYFLLGSTSACAGALHRARPDSSCVSSTNTAQQHIQPLLYCSALAAGWICLLASSSSAFFLWEGALWSDFASAALWQKASCLYCLDVELVCLRWLHGMFVHSCASRVAHVVGMCCCSSQHAALHW